MLWNFRFDRTATDEVLRRLRDERVLAQGWGGGDKMALRVSDADFVSKCKGWYELTSTRIPSNLTWMKAFKDGDLLVVPHLPAHGRASIHVVDGDFPSCYAFKDADPFHLNHGIRVRASYGLADQTISIYNHELAGWYGRLSGLRLPVIKLPDLEATFRTVVTELERTPTKALPESPLDDFLAARLNDVINMMKAQIRGIAASSATISFESVCEHLLTSWGYTIAARHEYDKKGGDVDLRCVRQRTETSPFETGETVLFVQVKKHAGTTDEWAVHQLVTMMAANPMADGCVMSLADDFSTKAKELAQQHGIMLVDGDTICRLLLGRLTAE